MPRPLKKGVPKQILLQVIEEERDVYEKMRKLAKREQISFSELALRAFKEYLERHWPGNPQIPLPVFIPTMMTPEHKKLKKRLEGTRVIRWGRCPKCRVTYPENIAQQLLWRCRYCGGKLEVIEERV